MLRLSWSKESSNDTENRRVFDQNTQQTYLFNK